MNYLGKYIFDQLNDLLPIWIWGSSVDNLFLSTVNEVKKIGVENIKHNKNNRLYIFMSSYRERYKRCKINQYKKKLLESIPGWKWDISFNRTEKAILEIKKEIQKNGGIENISRKNNYKLSMRIKNFRNSYKKKELNKNAIKLLESIPGWKWKTLENKIVKNILKFKKEIEKVGGIKNAPKEFHHKCIKYRVRYKKKELNKNAIKLLESIPGWKWSLSFERTEKAILEIKKEIQKNGGIENIPQKKNNKLYNKIMSFKYRYKMKELNKNAIKLLESIPGWNWNTYSIFKRSEANVLEIKKIGIKNIIYKSKLYNCINDVRYRYSKEKLNKNVKKLFESIPGWKW